MIGIDEVGRGAWAGPLLVVAVRQKNELPKGVKDSKRLSKKSRIKFINDIKTSCDIGCGWVKPIEIDKLGLTSAIALAVERALDEINAKINEKIIMDGNINYCHSKYKNVECVIKADDSHPIVSVASIYAKVTRDKFMTELAKEFLFFDFEKNVGYGTLKHRQALKQFGATKYHRLSYKPVKEYI